MAFVVYWSSFGAQATDALKVVTNPCVGVEVGASTYKLGQPISDLLMITGIAEKIVSDTYNDEIAKLMSKDEYQAGYLANTRSHVYINAGMIITEDEYERIKSMTFYVTGDKILGDDIIKPANVRTAEWISVGSSLNEIVRVYGEPYAKTSDNVFRYERVTVYYRRGSDVLSFRFHDGVLHDIGIHSKYLPYLRQREGR